MTRLAHALLLTALLCGSAPAAYDFEADWLETGTVGIGWGDAASTVGDVNGDGYSDILVGMPDYGSSPYWSQGAIALYYGSPTGPGDVPDWGFSVNVAFQRLGASIAPAGDMNADGYADFVVGAPAYSGGHSEEGRLYFFLGGPTGPALHTTAEVNDEDAWLGHSLAYAGDVNGDGYDDIIAGAPGWGGFGTLFYVPVQGRAYVYYGGPAGPDGTSDWNRAGGDEDGQFGWSVAGLGDVNGDGFADVMVGKPQHDPGVLDTNHGAVYAYYGSATGLSTSPDWSQVGTNAGDEFGRVVSFSGDCGGGGFAGALIGVPDYNGGDGAVFVTFGLPTGLQPAVILTSGFSSNWGGTVAPIGDFNGDGLADIVVGGGVDDDAYVYFGSLFGPYEERILGSGQFASLVASAGDVNGDGFGDFLVTDPIEQAGAGSIRIYFGGREIEYSVPLAHNIEGELGSDQRLGSSLSNAGDVNGDGFGDLLLGAPDHAGVGQAQLFFGKEYGISSSPDWSANGDGPDGSFGTSVSSAGDVNGDGYADIVVSDLGLQQVKVFHGSPSGPSLTADWSYAFTEGDEEFGAAVTGGGDINGDGYSDIAVGIPGYGFDQGIVRVFFGSLAGIQTASAIDRSSGGTTHRLGHALAIFGDGNGDGFDDLAVGAPGIDGRIVIMYGASAGFQAYSSIWLGEASDSQMGAAVAAAGDVNGDGYADFIGGEPYADINATDDGQAHVFFGNSPTVNSRVTMVAGSQSSDLHFGQAVCGIGDISGVGRSAVAVCHWSPGSQLSFVRIYEYVPSNGQMTIRSSFEITSGGEGMQIAGVGDFDGTGGPQLAFGLPNAESTDGEILLYESPGARGSIIPAAKARLTTTANAPIAFRGIAHATDDLRFHLNAWMPIGRTRLNMEWSCGEVRQPFAHGGMGSWVPSVTHIAGTPMSVDPVVALNDDTRYRWRVRVRSTNPYLPFGPWLSVQPNTDTLYAFYRLDPLTAVDGSTPSVSSSLAGAFPNPFNPRTQIELRLSAKESVELQIYDIKGRLVRTLHRGALEAGVHRLAWNGTDDSGRGVSSGVYLVLMRTENESRSLKLSLIK